MLVWAVQWRRALPALSEVVDKDGAIGNNPRWREARRPATGS